MMGQPSPQSSTMAIPKRWPLVTPFYTRAPDTPITKDARLINGFVEQDATDGEYWIFKRLGVGGASIFPSNPAGYPQGAYFYSYNTTPGFFLTQIYSVIGGNILVNTSNVGPISPGLQCYFETVNSNPQTVVIMNSLEAVIYTPSTGAFAQIVDANYPTVACPGWAYLDGTLYVMDYSGNIWGSKTVNNAAVWDGLNVVPASTKADQGVFLATQLTYVVAFKQWTTQIFYDALNATGSPLSPVPDAQIPFGCYHPGSVQKIDEILIWITSNQTISPQIAIMENLSPSIVSTPSVDRILDNVLINVGIPIAGDMSLYSWTLKHAGHRFYGLTLAANNLTLVYDIDQKYWSVWTDAFGNYWPIGNFTYIPSNTGTTGKHIAQLMNTAYPGNQGSLYPVDGDYEYPNDFGKVPAVDIYTPNVNGGTVRRKVLNMLYFEADQTPGSILQARYSDNDYKDWSNFRSIDLNQEKPFLDNEGTFQNSRAYHFRHQCNTRFRIKASELQLDIGSL